MAKSSGKFFRTSKRLESFNRELKRRSNVVDIFPNEESVLRLMGLVLIEKHNELLGRRAIFKASTFEKLLNERGSSRKTERVKNSLTSLKEFIHKLGLDYLLEWIR